MTRPLVHLVELAHTVEILDRLASRTVVDRALRQADIDRSVLHAGPGFVPYAIEAVILESVARSLGERHIGAHLGRAFDYTAYRSYTDYVLGAPDLAEALTRSRHAFPLLHPGSGLTMRVDGETAAFGYAHGLDPVVGQRHVSEAGVFVISQAFRRFLGPDWRPAWIEIDTEGPQTTALFEDMAETEVRTGADALMVGVNISELATPNPAPVRAADVVSLTDLPALMGVTLPKSTRDLVNQALLTQLAMADLSEDAVARRLSMGPRTLQRALMKEGTTFREVRSRFVGKRARALLAETDLPIHAIARSLGYSEPNSFRRAFRSWSKASPGEYRAMATGP